MRSLPLALWAMLLQPLPAGGLRWLTMFGADADNATAHPWANMLTAQDESTGGLAAVAAAHARGVRVLWQSPVYDVLNRSVDMHYRLQPGWQAATRQRLAPTLPFIANGSLSGFFVGDELVGNGMLVEEFGAFVRLLREVAGPRALLYANEGWGSINADRGFCNRACQGDVGGINGSCCTLRKLPPELDVISEDIYSFPGECSCGPGPCGTPACAGQACEAGAGKGLYSCSGWNSTAEVEWTQAEYEAHVFPLLHPHQKVFIVAGMFGCSNFSRKGGGLEAQSEVLVRKLRAHVEWARREPRESPIDVQATCACYLLERSY